MPVKQVFDKKEDAPEWLRSSLLEQDGKFVFEAELPTETAGLKSALEKERKLKADFEKALKTFEGIDAAKARELMDAAEKAESDKLKQKGDWETREKQLKDQLAKDLDAREQQYQTEAAKWNKREAALTRSLERHLIEAQATAAITAAKGVPELLLPHVTRAVRVVEEGEEFVAKVVDAAGNSRIADVKGSPFTVAHLIEEMRANPVYGRAFEASTAGGSGAGQSNGGGAGIRTVSRRDQDAINANLEKIAKGEITVVD